jgi:hypothetical protein
MANLVFNIVSGALPVLVEIVELEYSLAYYEYGEHTIYGLDPGTYTLHCTDINGCAVTIENIVIACAIPEGYEQGEYINSVVFLDPLDLETIIERIFFYNTDSLEDICDKLSYITEQINIYHWEIGYDIRYLYVDIVNYPTTIGSPIYDGETQCILEDGNYVSAGIWIIENGIISSIDLDLLFECLFPITTTTTSTTEEVEPEETTTTTSTSTTTTTCMPPPSLIATEISGEQNDDNIICAGSYVTFIAGLGYDNYNFKRNNISVQNGGSNVYQSNTFYDGEVVTVDCILGDCNARSEGITIHVNDYPAITQQPVNGEGCETGTAIFEVVTSAISPTYKWQYRYGTGVWNDLTGAYGETGYDTDTLTFNNLDGFILEGIKIQCVVTTYGCSTPTDEVTLTVNPLLQYRSAQTGDWEDLSTWEQYFSYGWDMATSYPGEITNDCPDPSCTIRDGHTVSVYNYIDYDFDSVIVEEGGTLILYFLTTTTTTVP